MVFFHEICISSPTPSELKKKNLKEMDKFSKKCHTQLLVYKYFWRNLGKLSLISSYDNEKDMRLTKLNRKYIYANLFVFIKVFLIILGSQK